MIELYTNINLLAIFIEFFWKTTDCLIDPIIRNGITEIKITSSRCLLVRILLIDLFYKTLKNLAQIFLRVLNI
jgi:hypothetical protein